MQVIKKIILFPYELIKILKKGIIFLALLLSRGFYFFLAKVTEFICFLTPLKFLNKLKNHFLIRQEQPEYFLFLVLLFLSFITFSNILYVKKEPLVNHDIYMEKDNKGENDDTATKENGEKASSSSSENTNSQDLNLYRKYSKFNLNEVDFSNLKATNDQTVAWLSIDYTNVNYPIVQTQDNDFYLNHTFDKSFNNNGWTFMDFRNNPNMEDKNTIFYGHNLLNKTAFGSLANIFKSDWPKKSNKTIIVMTETKKYYYEIFSAYYIEPELYYLTTYFNSDEEYQQFLNVIKSRNILKIDTPISSDDKIITLSTCSDDDKGRKVVHAKLVGQE